MMENIVIHYLNEVSHYFNFVIAMTAFLSVLYFLCKAAMKTFHGRHVAEQFNDVFKIFRGIIIKFFLTGLVISFLVAI